MKFEELAQELVGATSNLVGGRTINVMNTDGIIIASTETNRIGTLHTGAQKVATTGKPLAIEKHQLSFYPGAKEGYNMPIKSGDTIIGVVGIFGNPADIMDLAHLLEVYATKYFQLESLIHQKLMENDLRGRLLRLLLFPMEDTRRNTGDLIRTLQIRFQFPLRVMILQFSHPPASQNAVPRLSEQPADRLCSADLLQPFHDLWCMEENQLIMIRSFRQDEPNDLLQSFFDTGSQEGVVPRLAIGSVCHKLQDLPVSYQEAIDLIECTTAPIADIEDLETHCRCRLHQTAKQDARFIKDYYEKLCEAFHPQELDTLLETISCYYDENHSVAQAANRLFIHKNTLQYRIRRILEQAGLTNCRGFYQEYLIRLLIHYHNDNKVSGPKI